MNGSEYKKMVENFKASSELKQTTISAAHSHIFKKLKLTKREKTVRYTSVAAMFAMVVVLFSVFNVGEAISIAAKAINGQSSAANGSDIAQLSTGLSNEKSTHTSTEKSTEKVTANATSAPTTANTNTATSTMQIWNGSTTYTNTWTNMNAPISTVKYNISGSADSIEVNSLSITSTGNLFEAKVGPNENYTIRAEVHPALFNNGLVITKSSDGIVTFTNDKEGIILRENVFSYPKQSSESQSAYELRCINYLTECCTDATKAKQAFSLSDDYVFNTKSAIVMTNIDTEWRANMKLTYTGNPIATLSKNNTNGSSSAGFGNLTIVFDRHTQCFVVQTYVAQISFMTSMSTFVTYGMIYKVN
ncbi:hypothetical protein [[Clostridium] fimetarium]|uniref:Uncharacterized protein n=1 Tax=[Clostridium] fimetarium TaxID=99656 RepID=A0A1I0M5N0_9FIRM|nr:hypothetical protein [[Clostridium] fimetarium]SEV83589.1 hypothetical protein SAMN05421659_101209 [[Clostridium] fimetarium]